MVVVSTTSEIEWDKTCDVTEKKEKSTYIKRCRWKSRFSKRWQYKIKVNNSTKYRNSYFWFDTNLNCVNHAMSITKVCNSVSQQDSLERTISRPLQQEINQIEADEIALETSLSISHPEVQPSKQKTPSLTSCASSEKSSIQVNVCITWS